MVVFFIGLEVLCQIVNPLGQNRDLHFRGACIAVINSELFDKFGFLFFGNRHRILSIYWARSHSLLNSISGDYDPLRQPGCRPAYIQRLGYRPEARHVTYLARFGKGKVSPIRQGLNVNRKPNLIGQRELVDRFILKTFTTLPKFKFFQLVRNG